jgi:ABC-type transporter Mla subunit MlaD
MADTTTTGLGDLLALLGGNPIAALTKNIDTFRKGVEGFVGAVQNFNRTMETLDGVANRVTSLLDEVEEPIRVLMPQVTKATKQSLALFEKMSEPLERVAPGLDKLADTLGSPNFTTLPNVMGDFLEMLGELMNRLRPLGQIAEAAGSMFGMRAFSSLIPGATPAATRPAPAPPGAAAPAPVAPAAAPAPAKQPATKKPAAKKPAAKKASTASKKPAAKKAAPKR